MDRYAGRSNRLYVSFALAAVLAAVGLSALGRAEQYADVLFVVFCLVFLALQLVTGHTMTRIGLPSPHRRDDPAGYWVGIGLTSLATLTSLILMLARRGVLPIGS
ncbi:hypothetical protein FHY18_004266 [Xanthomonas arboricola]|nr:hypothetical protein [Xanthomonas sp. 3793]